MELWADLVGMWVHLPVIVLMLLNLILLQLSVAHRIVGHLQLQGVGNEQLVALLCHFRGPDHLLKLDVLPLALTQELGRVPQW